ESVCHGQRNVLAVIANHIVLEWRAPLYTDSFHSLSHDRSENLSDICAMKDCSHARHSLSRSRVQLLDFAICNRRFDRNGVEQVRKMEIRSVRRGTANFEWTIDARLRFADYGCLCALRHDIDLPWRFVSPTSVRARGSVWLFHFESILTLWFGIAQRGLRS